jgi:uncharacterized protein (TIGR02246 family)
MTESAAATRAINGLVSTLVSAWNAHDAHAFAGIFAEDADFTNVLGLAVHGRAAIEHLHATIFRTIFRDSSVAVSATTVRLLRPDVAAIDVRWTMSGARDPQGHPWPDREGLISVVATENGGNWLFTVFHNQDLPPPERVEQFAGLLRS